MAAAREPVVVGERMLGGVHAVEAGRLGRAGDCGDALGAHELRPEIDVVGGQGDVDLHPVTIAHRRLASPWSRLCLLELFEPCSRAFVSLRPDGS